MKTPPRLIAVVAGLALFFLSARLFAASRNAPWDKATANAWYAQQPFLAGGNYVPAYAINQLEMWQPETFDLAAIDRELGWARAIGFNSMRVFLHDILWREDPLGFLDRVDRFLGVADKHGISTMFVFFDSVWHPAPKAGRQPAPTPHRHNSGWVQSPGVELLGNLSRYGELEAYVKAVLTRFHADRRVVAWDLFNEPNNPNTNSYGSNGETPHKAELGLILLREVFGWAWEVNPTQPLTAGVWEGEWGGGKPVSAINTFMLGKSDVISFHCYDPIEKMRERIAVLQQLGRPLLCTEYMARPRESRFETILPVLLENKIAAYNWGFIEGKSQTNYPWDSWKKTYTAEPPEWFHDVLRTDGTPYKESEAAFLRAKLR